MSKAAEIVGKIVQNAMNKGLMLEAAGTFNNVIRILCPLVATDEQLEAAGVPADMIRLSVGLEDAGDLIDDISQALDRI